MTSCAHRHLLVVGAQRCGTTYLATALDAHPDVAMARPSRPEPKVFNDASLSALGLVIGRQFGARVGRRLDVFGGVVLVLFGTKILVEHLIS